MLVEPLGDGTLGLLAPLSERFKFKRPLRRSTLYEWDKTYRRPADLVALIDTRGHERRAGGDDAAWSLCRDYYLHQNQPSLRQVCKLVAAAAKESDWRWCSYRSCRRQLDSRIPPEVQMMHRDPDRWRQKYQPCIAQNPERAAAGELWVGDHKELDFICRWRGQLIRPWLTAWMDWQTRRIAGFFISSQPDSATILAALHHGLKDDRNFGGPRAVWTDNGKDYDAWIFHGQTKKQRRQRINVAVDEPAAHGIFSLLQIKPHFARERNPNGKARMERWFRPLEDFCRTFDTYTGGSPDSKPEQLNAILATPHRVPAFEQIAERLTSFIAGCNADADHRIDDLVDPEDGKRLSSSFALFQEPESSNAYESEVLTSFRASCTTPALAETST